MVRNEYPSLDRAIALLDKSPSVAFSRDFSVMRDPVISDLIFLYHKGSKVGIFMKNEIALGAKFNCLKESLTEMKLKVGVR
jgi:hypothetical protein